MVRFYGLLYNKLIVVTVYMVNRTQVRNANWGEVWGVEKDFSVGARDLLTFGGALLNYT